MKTVQIQCDRCKKIVDGIIGDVPLPGIPNKFIDGFYDVTTGIWKKFARYGETNLCDECMHNDPSYKETYG